MKGFNPKDRRPWQTEAEWARLRRRIAVAEPARRVGAVGRFALATAAVLVVAVGIWHFRNHVVPARVAATEAGQRLAVRLGDGSTVTLGPRSSVRYTETAARVEIGLTGMAEFHVAHDGRRTFVVRARDAIVEDIGTEFVVRAYAEDSLVRVAVQQGAVSIVGRRPGTPALQLRAGEVGAVGGGLAQQLASTEREPLLRWIEGSLVFDEQPLSSVAVELGRWFAVDIKIPDQTLARRRVSAVYNAATLEEILTALAATSRFDYVGDGKTFILRSRSQ